MHFSMLGELDAGSFHKHFCAAQNVTLTPSSLTEALNKIRRVHSCGGHCIAIALATRLTPQLNHHSTVWKNREH